jgi:hypothetical protein
MRDYLRATDLAHLPEEAIALYDDDTAKASASSIFGDKLLHDAHADGGRAAS